MQTMVPLYGFGGVPYSAVRKAAPRNLLDNSDFRNPVNQRGQSSYSFDSGYTIDRWYLNWSGDGTLSIADGHITLRRQTYQCYMYQKMDNAEEMVGKTYTVAAKCRGSGSIGWIDSAQDVSNVFELGDWGVVTKTFTVASATHSVLGVPAVKINSNSDKSVDVAWIVLYEGEYTAETLPEYHPKGYGAELLECQRYYQIRSANNVTEVDMRPTMRLSRPTITSVSGGYAYSADL